MKKYLLLAATAMLFSTNAMATTYPDLDDQTATVTVKADIIPVCKFINTESDITIGTIYVFPGDDDFEVTVDASECYPYSSDSGIYIDDSGAPEGQGSCAQFITSCPYGDSTSFSLSCISGGSVSDGCSIGSSDYTFAPDAYTFDDGSGKMVRIAGTFKGPRPSSEVNLNDAAILVTINYE